MRTVIAIPPMPRMTGGIAVLYQVAERLRELGREVVITGNADAPGMANEAARGATILPWTTLSNELRPEDTFVIAEGWPNMAAPALAAKCRIFVYAQNWAYVFSALPHGVRWQNLPVSFIAVSDPVRRFLEKTHLPVAGEIRPAIDAARFAPRQPDAAKRLRIAYMPRKNKALADQIRQIFTAMDDASSRVEWLEIHKMTSEEVAEVLGTSHIFLATGFPEGCPLPPLEAMASGCLVVGFAGYGGWDYMRQATAGGYAPRFALRETPFSPNGFFAADGDVMEGATLLAEAAALARQGGEGYRALREAAFATAAVYSAESQRAETARVFA
ncbi:MAG: hypothetical protein DELT_02369 [Desulfovibrio sp.]